MSYRGQPSWPPRVWVNCEELRSSEEPTTLRGEVGVLTGVLRNQLLPDKLFLYIDHEEKEYVGSYYRRPNVLQSDARVHSQPHRQMAKGNWRQRPESLGLIEDSTGIT